MKAWTPRATYLYPRFLAPLVGVLVFCSCSVSQPADAPSLPPKAAALSATADSQPKPDEPKTPDKAKAPDAKADEPKSSPAPEKQSDADKLAAFRRRVQHIIVIYQENWSFDGLYGKFPGANGVHNSGDAAKQIDKLGIPYTKLPLPTLGTKPDPRFAGADLPVAPFDLARFVKADDRTPDLVHSFYHEQAQINGGKMNKFVGWSDAAGLAMSYYDATNMPEGKLAQQYTLCDNFFHSAFGGSFLNHMYLIAAAAPQWKDAPAEMVIRAGEADAHEGQVTEDGYVVNTTYSVNLPHRRNEAGDDIWTSSKKLLPNQTMPTIGDRLDAKKIDWAWYAGGWDLAMSGNTDPKFNSLFQFHHHPFTYFTNYADGTPGKARHLKDEEDFLISLRSGSLPAVSFIKPFGEDNEHPGYASLMRGQAHVARLVNEVRDSDYWKDSLIIITYDEHGGRWDHVPPPVKDRFGPGVRVPAIIISPFKQVRPVDHTEYETVSILKLIEKRFELEPLTERDKNAGDLLNAFQAF